MAIDLQFAPQPPDATALAPDFLHEIVSKGLVPSWQRYDQRSLVLLRQYAMRPVTADEVKNWNPRLAEKLFSSTSLEGYVIENGLIRNGDLVLCVVAKEQREEIMAWDRQRRDKQMGDIEDPAQTALRKQLEELGVLAPDPSQILGMKGQETTGSQVAVHGFDSDAEARKAGVRRKGGGKEKE